MVKAWPWAAIPVVLWSVQVWSIWGSPFSIEVTMLQGIFVMAWVVLIVVLTQVRLDEEAT